MHELEAYETNGEVGEVSVREVSVREVVTCGQEIRKCHNHGHSGNDLSYLWHQVYFQEDTWNQNRLSTLCQTYTPACHCPRSNTASVFPLTSKSLCSSLTHGT